MVVEDTQDVANIILLVLRKMGMELVHVTTGQEAIDYVKENHPKLMILDIGLPGIDGWQVLDKIREDPSTSDLSVVIITAYSDADSRRQSNLYGVDAYLAKPVTPNQLRETISRVLGLN